MRTAILIVLSSLIALFQGPVASAETVTTTFGKTFQGEILENTDDYIKIKVAGGAVYKIKKRQIEPDTLEMIDGGGEGEQSGDAVLDEGPARTLADWEEWMEANETYLKRMEYLQESFFNVMSASTKKINQCLERGRAMEGLQVGESASAQVTLFKKQAQDIQPPEELKRYHNKMSESFSDELKAMNAWLLGDQQVYYQYHKRGAVAFIAAVEEQARVYQRQGAPANIVDGLERLVQRQKELLDERYH